MRTGTFGGAARAATSRAAQAAADTRDAATAGGTRFVQAATDAKDYATDMAERTMQKAGSWASSASAMAGDAGRAVGEQSGRFVHQAQGTMQRVLQEQPVFVAIAGMAAGAALAAAFPATNFERENLGPIGRQVSDAAGRVGEQLKEATAQAGESLKNAVQERGLNPDGFKEVATEVADAFAGSMGDGSDQTSGRSTRSGSSPSGRSG
jgi:hypothetical protein